MELFLSLMRIIRDLLEVPPLVNGFANSGTSNQGATYSSARVSSSPERWHGQSRYRLRGALLLGSRSTLHVEL